jgi:uncharacterized protein YceK
MKLNLVLCLCLALVLGGGLTGCSTIHSTKPGEETGQPLYLYYGYESWNSAQRYLSTRIHPGEDISVGGDDYWELKGKIERHGSHLIADLTGGTGQEGHFYQGEIVVEKPFLAQGGIASGGAGPGWFMVSTNSDCLTILKRVNATLGLTNAPFNHPATMSPPPAPANVPGNIDPNTGLPNGHPLLDPNTGLPLPQK